MALAERLSLQETRRRHLRVYFVRDRDIGRLIICGSACSIAFKAPRHFACDFPGCEKSYEKRKQLTAHVQAAHSDVRHGPCPCCDLTFARRGALKQHLKRKRQQISEELQQPDPESNVDDRRITQPYADDYVLITAHTPMLCCNCI